MLISRADRTGGRTQAAPAGCSPGKLWWATAARRTAAV